jgi:pyruvate kinase
MSQSPDLERLRRAIDELRTNACAQEAELSAEIARLSPTHTAAGRNLAHYLALRQHDLRELQGSLAALGLSSLGRSERCVMATLNAVGHALARLADPAAEERPPPVPPVDFAAADELLRRHTDDLIGPPPAGRAARIMLTLPVGTVSTEIEALLAGGADVIRLNCSKDSPAEWGELIERVRSLAKARGRHCAILCDLAGPNPRTASLRGETDVIARVGVGARVLLARPGHELPELIPGVAAALGCTLPAVLDDLVPGERIYYDDGKLAGMVRELRADGVLVEITWARKERVKLRAGKGLNFPDSTLRLPALTPKDLADLAFVARHADMVGLSFVRSIEHVEMLQRELERLGAGGLGIVLKIETTRAFQELPRLLLAAMRSPRVGIMVARGDMAIELGFERLAEAQEEVLWLSEAASVPVIWATQVLESLNKTGIPSRAEVTDAAMASRAECVMLNQGTHLLEASRFLKDVLERMEQHQQKKRSMLRRLRISQLS